MLYHFLLLKKKKYIAKYFYNKIRISAERESKHRRVQITRNFNQQHDADPQGGHYSLS